MSEFILFQNAVSAQFKKLEDGVLFTSHMTKDDAYDTYLDSFPANTNKVFRERREHDCNCCKQYIRAVGNVLGVVGDNIESIWDIDPTGVPEHYVIVAKAMAEKSKENGIAGIFLHYEKSAGTKRNKDNTSDIIWDHFHKDLPKHVVVPKSEIATANSVAVSNFTTFKRSIEEISMGAVDTVLELVESDNLYKGNEYLHTLTLLKTCIQEHRETSNKEVYLWLKSLSVNVSFRNSAIGKLLLDIDKGIDLGQAVASFETMVAPSNYKRSKSVVTAAQIAKAHETVQKLGIEESLLRRHAVTSDLTINNVLHANRTTKKSMGVFDSVTSTPVKVREGKATEVSIQEFTENVLPKAETVELLLQNRHTGNLMSLVAPCDEEAPGILKWDNNFSWTYNGDITDSMKESVKSAGGNVEGVVRFSISWNEDGENLNDLDAHCLEPGDNLIFFQNAKQVQRTSGVLDVDITHPKGKAVENIVHTDKAMMRAGKYQYYVHNYSGRDGKNFRAQLEVDGVTLDYSFEGALKQREKVHVADVILKNGQFSTISHLKDSTLSKKVWGLDTEQFYKVSMMMLSPNYWDDNSSGNKHYFFILEGCLNPDSARGLYNEFLSKDLYNDRKVFEQLGSKLKAPYSTEQCSGLGFSETIRNDVTVKVDSRLYTIKF